MFKKRAQNIKKADLNMEVEEINSAPVEPKEQTETIPNKPRFTTTIDIESQVGTDNRISASSQYQILDSITKEEEYHNNYHNYQQQKTNADTLVQQEQIYTNTQQINQEYMMEEIVEVSESESVKKPIIIEDESGQQVEFLQIVEDISGGIDIDENFEDEIIKKALTRENYQKIKKSEKVLEGSESKQLKLIKKITQSSVMQAIDKDILKVQNSTFEIRDRIQYHKQIAETSIKRLKPMLLKHEQSKQKLQKVKKILKLIYYRASQIKEFTMEGLLKQVQEQQQNIVV